MSIIEYIGLHKFMRFQPKETAGIVHGFQFQFYFMCRGRDGGDVEAWHRRQHDVALGEDLKRTTRRCTSRRARNTTMYVGARAAPLVKRVWYVGQDALGTEALRLRLKESTPRGQSRRQLGTPSSGHAYGLGQCRQHLSCANPDRRHHPAPNIHRYHPICGIAQGERQTRFSIPPARASPAFLHPTLSPQRRYRQWAARSLGSSRPRQNLVHHNHTRCAHPPATPARTLRDTVPRHILPFTLPTSTAPRQRQISVDGREERSGGGGGGVARAHAETMR
ncbi:hypothetical protein C8J57DRAFT_1731231 [Mycena rebaudengoi]|nr:hypothetical protein C8J57DRAFT_1731231 [Mycena rebaudengoi]